MRALLLAAAFAIELWALAAFWIAGRDLADGFAGWLLGAALVVVAIGAWARWAAPRSRTRLAGGPLLAFQLAFFAIASAVLAASGSLLHGALLLAVSAAVLLACHAMSLDAADVSRWPTDD